MPCLPNPSHLFFCDSYICHVYQTLIHVLLWQLHMPCLPNLSQFICVLIHLMFTQTLVSSFVLLWRLHKPCLPDRSKFICLFCDTYMCDVYQSLCCFGSITGVLFTIPYVVLGQLQVWCLPIPMLFWVNYRCDVYQSLTNSCVFCCFVTPSWVRNQSWDNQMLNPHTPVTGQIISVKTQVELDSESSHPSHRTNH